MFTRVHREPLWSAAMLRQAPGPLRPWLSLHGSLTRALRRLSHNQLRVEVLSQYWGLPQPSEWRALGLDARQRCLVREVVLMGADQPWVFARSILPARSLVGSLRRLRQLDNRPLGEILFADRRIRRGPLQVALLRPGHHNLTHLARLASEPVWGRRSTFSLNRQRLLVAEIFLPGFPGNSPGNPPNQNSLATPPPDSPGNRP